MFDLDNKVAVITGSARGLGQAIALSWLALVQILPCVILS